MYALDSWCEYMKLNIYVTPHGGTSGTHVPGSLHYKGEAADIMIFHRNGNTLLDLFISLNRFPFTEIGLYPHWDFKGSRVGGIHVGMNSVAILQNTRRKYWIGIKTTLGKQTYTNITESNLKLYGII